MRVDGVDDCPERDLHEQGLVFFRNVRVQEREASISKELHGAWIRKKKWKNTVNERHIVKRTFARTSVKPLVTPRQKIAKNCLTALNIYRYISIYIDIYFKEKIKKNTVCNVLYYCIYPYRTCL